VHELWRVQVAANVPLSVQPVLVQQSDEATVTDSKPRPPEIEAKTPDSAQPAVSQVESCSSASSSGDGRRKCQSSWKLMYHWINYVNERVYCKVCQSCTDLGLFLFSTKRDEAFITKGYSNWKNALAKFANHDTSQSHQEAVRKIVARGKETNVAGSLVAAHHQERLLARDAMFAVTGKNVPGKNVLDPR
jgi:hypothetical protein